MRIAGYADWSRARPAQPELARLMGASPGWAVLPDPFVGLIGEGSPINGQIDHISLVGDARIDNLPELRLLLGSESGESVVRVLVTAYLRWGTMFADRLVGDFALVLWDARQRRMVACRDPFGIRPLAYRRTGSSLWFASEPAQLLRTFDAKPDLDDQSIVEYLLWRHKPGARTFFRDIHSVLPGFVLTVNLAAERSDRFWSPPSRSHIPPDTEPAEYYEELRRVFGKAVERRLASVGPTVIHVSGGLDSSAIAVAADDIGRRRSASLIGAAAVFPGLACDESFFIDAVARQIAFPIRRWDGRDSEAAGQAEPAIDDPDGNTVTTSGVDGDAVIATETGATVILSGVGGDELMTFEGFVRDLLSAHEWRGAFRGAFLLPGSTTSSRIARLRRLASQFAPDSLRAWKARATADVPPWLAPDLRLRARDLAVADSYQLSFASHMQRFAWTRLHNGYLRRALGAMQRKGFSLGIEYRFPYFDRELATCVLGIPRSCLPSDVTNGRIHREALRTMLPREISERHSKADFTPALIGRLRRSTTLLNDLFSGGRWASGRYVDRVAAQAFWRIALATPEKLRTKHWWRLWGIARLEAWMRKISEYDATS